MADRPGFFRRFFGGLWSFLNFTRQLILNVLFFAIVAVLLLIWFGTTGRQRLVPIPRSYLICRAISSRNTRSVRERRRSPRRLASSVSRRGCATFW